MTDKEREVLNKIADEWFGCNYNNLYYEDQDQIYCYAEENGLLPNTPNTKEKR